jgi:hypothetical protein
MTSPWMRPRQSTSWLCFVDGGAGEPVVLDQPDGVEALRFHAPPAHVISNGRSVDTAKMLAIVAAGTGPA